MPCSTAHLIPRRSTTGSCPPPATLLLLPSSLAQLVTWRGLLERNHRPKEAYWQDEASSRSFWKFSPKIGNTRRRMRARWPLHGPASHPLRSHIRLRSRRASCQRPAVNSHCLACVCATAAVSLSACCCGPLLAFCPRLLLRCCVPHRRSTVGFQVARSCSSNAGTPAAAASGQT